MLVEKVFVSYITSSWGFVNVMLITRFYYAVAHDRYRINASTFSRIRRQQK